MSQLKKVLISVPEPLLSEVDQICSHENLNRSKFIREAMKCYVAKKRHNRQKEQMAKGYQEMASINLELAETFFDLENQQFSEYEEKLAECESCGC